MKELRINSKHFIHGVENVPFSGDRAIAIDSYYNPFIEYGAVNGSSTTTITGMLSKAVAAYTEKTTLPDYDMIIVDDQGNIYGYNTNTITKLIQDTTQIYQEGTTDIVYFSKTNKYYISSQQDVGELTVTGTPTYTANWFTTNSGCSALNQYGRHPLAVVEDTLYIADGRNLIHIYDGTTFQCGAIQIPPNNIITEMIKHPNGRDLIVFTSEAANYSHTRNIPGKVYIIDTVTFEFISEIVIEAQVEAAVVAGGNVYVTYGNRFGVFNGAGLDAIRTFEEGPKYSNKIAVADDFIFIADNGGQNSLQKAGIFVYGDFGAGNTFIKLDNSQNINLIAVPEINKNAYGEISPSIFVQYSTNSSKVIDTSQNGQYQIITSQLGDAILREVEIRFDNSVDYNQVLLSLYSGRNGYGYGITADNKDENGNIIPTNKIKIRYNTPLIENMRIAIQNYQRCYNLREIIIRYD